MDSRGTHTKVAGWTKGHCEGETQNAPTQGLTQTPFLLCVQQAPISKIFQTTSSNLLIFSSFGRFGIVFHHVQNSEIASDTKF